MIDRYEQVLKRVLMGAETVGGSGAATAPVLPEGAVETGDDFAATLEDAKRRLDALDRDLAQVQSMELLTAVKNALAKKHKMKEGDIQKRWLSLNPAKEEENKALAAFQRDVQPSDKPESLKEVFTELVETYRHFIVFKDRNDQPAALALWTMATWFVDSINFAPYVLITAPEKRCGKSQLLGLISKLSRRPLNGASLSAPVLFRMAEAYQPTIFIDEVDSFLDRDEDLKGMIKCGIERGQALAWRMEKDPITQKQNPVPFDCFGFKALSGIGAQNIEDTITDRCIVIELKRKLKQERVPKVRNEPAEKWQALNAKCARLALDYGERLKKYRPLMPDQMSDRDADKWEPLIALADLIDGDEGLAGTFGKMGTYGDACRAVAVRLSNGVDADEPMAVELLRNIRDVLNEDEETAVVKVDYILSMILTERLNRNKEWRWYEMHRGSGISPRLLAKWLKNFDIRPGKIREEGNKSGYRKIVFQDPFERYLGERIRQELSEENPQI